MEMLPGRDLRGGKNEATTKEQGEEGGGEEEGFKTWEGVGEGV